MDYFYHENLHRSDRVMKIMSSYSVVICGAGSLGANVAENLARAGVSAITIIDMDLVEERNLSTQPYSKIDIGAKKALVLANNLIRVCGSRAVGEARRLDENNARKLLRNANVVVDTFDNSVSRAIVKKTCAELHIPCIHAGMASQYSEVIWDPGYVVPSAANDDVCDYPLARNLAVITSAMAAESVIRWMADGSMENYSFTLRDMKSSKEN